MLIHSLGKPCAQSCGEDREAFILADRLGYSEAYCGDKADEDVTLDYVLDRLVIHGDPASVADQMLEFREVTGPFGHLVYAGQDWTDVELDRQP